MTPPGSNDFPQVPPHMLQFDHEYIVHHNTLDAES